ncbi:MAG: anti-sigma factor [Acidobacteria bacterium]|nr:anti-sigma factor [Acidobacteriota bacterium]
MSDTFDPRLEDLAERVVFAHDADVPAFAPGGDAAAFERTAALAAAALALAEPPPPRLQQRLAAAGLAFCAERRRPKPSVHALPPTAPALPPSPAAAGPAQRRTRWPYLVFAAAALALIWLVRPGSGRDAGSERARLLTTQDVVHLDWKPGPSPLAGAVLGDVVWSQHEQRGYLRFQGLPPLDQSHRFQLWIVDGSRTGAPVDGGLFAIADAKADTVVPIAPKLPIGKAAAFVVTVEEWAGVVVSEKKDIVAIAGL